MSGVAPRPLSALSNEELAKLLPDYAHPNWQGDGFKLVKYRLWNGGFDRLEKYGDIPRYSPNLRTDILNSTPKIETSATLGEQPGIGLYRQSYSVNKDVMDKLTDAQDVGAHELVHYMYRPSKKLNWHIMLDNTLKDQKDVIISVRAELLSRQLEEPKSRIIMV